MGKPTKRNEIPLQPQVSLEPFDKWGMDFIGPIDPPSRKKRHILVCTDYLTKWDEVKDMKDATKQNVVAFLQECIFSRFGYPREIVTDQGPQFTSRLIEEIMKEHNIIIGNQHPTIHKKMDRLKSPTRVGEHPHQNSEHEQEKLVKETHRSNMGIQHHMEDYH
jgi:hypothetical protein